MRKLAEGVVPRVLLDMTREFDMIRECLSTLLRIQLLDA